MTDGLNNILSQVFDFSLSEKNPSKLINQMELTNFIFKELF